MTKNIIKFPESFEQACKRIDRKYDPIIAKCERDIKKMNWFTLGLFAGMAITVCVGLFSYYCVGV